MIIKYSISKISLLNLLKRKKTTLKIWVKDSGISTYDQLIEQCRILGVIVPSIEEFEELFPKLVVELREQFPQILSEEALSEIALVLENDLSFTSQKSKSKRQIKLIAG